MPPPEGIYLLQASGKGEEHWTKSQETWIVVSRLMLKCCVTSATSLSLSGPQFSHCKRRVLARRFPRVLPVLKFLQLTEMFGQLYAKLSVPGGPYGHVNRFSIGMELSRGNRDPGRSGRISDPESQEL